jgi:hypothetical protein
VVEPDIQQVVDLAKFLARNIDTLLPDLLIFLIPLLKLQQFCPALLEHFSILLSKVIGFAVNSDQFQSRICFEIRRIHKVLPSVNHFAKLRSPIAEMIVGDNAVAYTARNPRQNIAEDRRTNVSNVHRLGYVWRAEVDHNRPLMFHALDAEPFVKSHTKQLLGNKSRRNPEIYKTGTSNFCGKFGAVRQQWFYDPRSELPRVFAEPFPKNQRYVGLIISEPGFVGGR